MEGFARLIFDDSKLKNWNRHKLPIEQVVFPVVCARPCPDIQPATLQISCHSELQVYSTIWQKVRNILFEVLGEWKNNICCFPFDKSDCHEKVAPVGLPWVLHGFADQSKGEGGPATDYSAANCHFSTSSLPSVPPPPPRTLTLHSFCACGMEEAFLATCWKLRRCQCFC